MKKKKAPRSEAEILQTLPTLCCVRTNLCVHRIGKHGFQIYCSYCGRAGNIRATLLQAAKSWLELEYPLGPTHEGGVNYHPGVILEE